MRLPAEYRHRRHPTAKLTADEVRWLRNRVKGWRVSVSEAVRRLKTDPMFAMLGDNTLRDVLARESWGKVS
jgi:hypothetical protein